MTLALFSGHCRQPDTLILRPRALPPAPRSASSVQPRPLAPGLGLFKLSLEQTNKPRRGRKLAAAGAPASCSILTGQLPRRDREKQETTSRSLISCWVRGWGLRTLGTALQGRLVSPQGFSFPGQSGGGAGWSRGQWSVGRQAFLGPR